MRQRVSGNLFTHKTSTAMFGFKINKACSCDVNRSLLNVNEDLRHTA